MRKLLQDIKYSQDGKLYELAHRLLDKEKDITEKEYEIKKLLQEVSQNNFNSKLEIEFKSQAYYSFYSTSIEKDKSLLALSVAGLGFLVTFINVTNKFLWFEFLFFVIAALSFLFCIFNVFRIFDKNKDYIVALTTDSEKTGEEGEKLKTLDKRANGSFYLGICMSLALGLCVSITTTQKENQMTDKKPTSSENSKPVNESFSGVELIKKSFAGAAQMRPETSQSGGTSNSNTQSTNSKPEKK